MSVQQLGENVKLMKSPGFVPMVTPFRLGRLAAKIGMQPQAHWPLDMVIGWDNAGGVPVAFSEESLVGVGWRENM